MWPVQSSLVLLSLNGSLGTEQDLTHGPVKWKTTAVRVNTKHLHRLHTKHQWVPDYLLKDLKLFLESIFMHISIAFINKGKCKGQWKWSGHFYTLSKAWMNKRPFTLVFRYIFTMNKNNEKRSFLCTLAFVQVSKDIKVLIILIKPLW